MPLSQKQLELLRKKCNANEVYIDVEAMSHMTAQEAMTFFVNGGQMPDLDTQPANVVERRKETELLYTSEGSGPKQSAEVSSEIENEPEPEKELAGIDYARKKFAQSMEPPKDPNGFAEWQQAREFRKLHEQRQAERLRNAKQAESEPVEVD